jgi:hypothetical protein
MPFSWKEAACLPAHISTPSPLAVHTTSFTCTRSLSTRAVVHPQGMGRAHPGSRYDA